MPLSRHSRATSERRPSGTVPGVAAAVGTVLREDVRVWQPRGIPGVSQSQPVLHTPPARCGLRLTDWVLNSEPI